MLTTSSNDDIIKMCSLKEVQHSSKRDVARVDDHESLALLTN